jgi:predicted AlkP superfamily pyrophosphatase or phosphodiesterase
VTCSRHAALAAVLLALAALAALVAPSPARAAGIARHVVLISIDGLRPDALLKATAPTLQGLIPRGSASLEARTILPSSTLPSHASMLTGVSVTRHGLTWNSWKPAYGPVRVPTVFEVARACGRSTAMFAGKDKFRHLERPATLDAFEIPAYEALKVAARAASHVLTNKPELMFVHLADVDGAGHRFGWMSPFQMRAVTRCDSAVARILAALDAAGIRDRAAVIVTADHGGHLFTHGSDRPVDMTIPWIAAGAGVREGVTIPRGIVTFDTAATALALLGVRPPADWDGKPVRAALAAGVMEAIAPAGDGARLPAFAPVF